MNYILLSVLPATGVLSAFIAILIGQSIDEKRNLKESQLYLLVLLITILLTLSLDALLWATLGDKQ